MITTETVEPDPAPRPSPDLLSAVLASDFAQTLLATFIGAVFALLGSLLLAWIAERRNYGTRMATHFAGIITAGSRFEALADPWSQGELQRLVSTAETDTTERPRPLPTSEWVAAVRAAGIEARGGHRRVLDVVERQLGQLSEAQGYYAIEYVRNATAALRKFARGELKRQPTIDLLATAESALR